MFSLCNYHRYHHHKDRFHRCDLIAQREVFERVAVFHTIADFNFIRRVRLIILFDFKDCIKMASDFGVTIVSLVIRT